MGSFSGGHPQDNMQSELGNVARLKQSRRCNNGGIVGGGTRSINVFKDEREIV